MLSFDVIVLQNFESPLCSQQYDFCDQTSEAAEVRDLYNLATVVGTTMTRARLFSILTTISQILPWGSQFKNHSSRSWLSLLSKKYSPSWQYNVLYFQDDFEDIITRADIKGSSSEEDQSYDIAVRKELKYGLPLRKRKVRNLAAALDTVNYTVQPVPITENVVKGILNSKNPADDLTFTSKVPTAGM